MMRVPGALLSLQTPCCSGAFAFVCIDKAVMCRHGERPGLEPGYMIFYNRDFYCVEIHDAEVACDGLLYNNIYNAPMTPVADEHAAVIAYFFHQMEDESELGDSSAEFGSTQ
jgi:hypothetical protein